MAPKPAPPTPQKNASDNSDDDDYLSDDDADPALITPRQDPAIKAFERIVTDAAEGRLKLSKSEQRNEFRKKYSQYFEARVDPERQTFFHYIANRLAHKGLALLLMNDCWHQLEMVDQSGNTPLYTAILRNNVRVFNVILEGSKKLEGEKKKPDDMLKVKCEHGRNSIHAALLAPGMDEKDVIELIKRASEETLCMQDDDGLTPLHLAVSYNRCSESQLRIIRELISRGDKALDKFTKNPADLSVYEYHEYTRERALKRSRTTPTTDKAHGARIDSGKSVKELGQVGQAVEQTAQTHSDSQTADGSIFDRGSHGSVRNGVKPLTIWRVTDDSQGVESAPVAAPSEQHRSEAPSGRLTESETIKNEWADKIGREIKLLYLRTTFRRPYPRDQSQALRFIHGANIEDRNLCFDYSKATTPVSQSSFRQSFAHMKFDNVLRYVAFNKIDVHSPVPKNAQLQARRSAQQPGRGRTDLVFFFKWLREKNVEHILKVVVNDWPEMPHSDRAIEDCLKEFEVERLEWRKLDLCPETLFNACRNARHLNLWWSGNRAILRSWSEPEGLAKLEKLETITLLWDSSQVLESAKRIESYIVDFRRRLEKVVSDSKSIMGDSIGLRSLTVETVPENNPRNDSDALPNIRGKPLNLTNQRNLSGHRWLNCMDKLADEIQNIGTPSTQDDKLRRGVVVALIDDGVNVDTPAIAGKVISGVTFDRGEPDENGPSPYFHSANGHGTVMADMICRVCPLAKLYVFKLETHSSHDSMTESQAHSQIVTRSAALAVNAAVARNVDIISISWTVKKPRDTGQDSDLNELGKSIRTALDRDILVFCAAGDAGNFSDEEYPYEFDRNRIIRIGAATDDGRPWERSGDPHNLDFIFPGYAVVSRNTRPDGIPAHFREHTGSSIATALAAGLAALVLHCVRLAAILKENDTITGLTDAEGLVEASQLSSLRDYRNMKAVFEKIGVDRDKHKFIEVWNRFEGPAEILRSDPERASKVIMELAIKLVSSKFN